MRLNLQGKSSFSKQGEQFPSGGWWLAALAHHAEILPPNPLGPLGFNFSQHVPTTRPSVERTNDFCLVRADFDHRLAKSRVDLRFLTPSWRADGHSDGRRAWRAARARDQHSRQHQDRGTGHPQPSTLSTTPRPSTLSTTPRSWYFPSVPQPSFLVCLSPVFSGVPQAIHTLKNTKIVKFSSVLV